MLQGEDCHEAYQCLGIIDSYITGPWETAAGKDEHILHMNAKFHHAQQQIQTWINDSRVLFSGAATRDCFGSAITSDNFMRKVCEEGPTDSSLKLMQMLLDALLNTINKQLADKLPGGKFWEPSEALREQTKSCVATNISGERQFAKMKVIQQKAPRMTMTKVESRKMFDSNKIKDKMLQTGSSNQENRSAERKEIQRKDKR